jgi:hypothetical protein
MVLFYDDVVVVLLSTKKEDIFFLIQMDYGKVFAQFFKAVWWNEFRKTLRAQCEDPISKSPENRTTY